MRFILYKLVIAFLLIRFLIYKFIFLFLYLFHLRFGKLPADNLTPQDLSPPPDQYWSMKAYNNAKLCNVLFASKLAKVIIKFIVLDGGNDLPTRC